MFYAYPNGATREKAQFYGAVRFTQFIEWNDHQQLDWCLLAYEPAPPDAAVCPDIKPAVPGENMHRWQTDDSWAGFQWMNRTTQTTTPSVLSVVVEKQRVLVLCNFAPVCWRQYRVAVPRPGQYRLFYPQMRRNSGGSGLALLQVQWEEAYGQEQWVTLTLPPALRFIIQCQNCNGFLLHRGKENASEI